MTIRYYTDEQPASREDYKVNLVSINNVVKVFFIHGDLYIVLPDEENMISHRLCPLHSVTWIDEADLELPQN